MDGMFLAQVEHHFQMIQPVTRVKVQRANSQLCSRCSITQLDDPKESPHYVCVKLAKPDELGDLPSESESASEPDEQLIRSRVTSKVEIKRATLQRCWKCHKLRSLRVSNHIHRMGDQGIACVGRCSSEAKATQLLWKARNLAINLRGVLCGSTHVKAHDQRHSWSQDPAVPEVWIASRAITSIRATTLQRLLSFIKYSNLFGEIFNPSDSDWAAWRKNWRLMTDAHGSGIETLARDLFGNPSLPYPEIDLTSILIQFKLTSTTSRPVLLRLVLGIEPKPQIRDCEACACDFMILDYIEKDAAVKIHIPLTGSLDLRRHSNWEEFSKLFSTKTRSENSRWSEMGYLYQGWSEQILSRRVVDLDRDVRFDETGGSEHTSEYQPFPDDNIWKFWSGDLMSEELRTEAEAKDEVWNENGECSDESDVVFDPFLEEHDRKRKRVVLLA